VVSMSAATSAREVTPPPAAAVASAIMEHAPCKYRRCTTSVHVAVMVHMWGVTCSDCIEETADGISSRAWRPSGGRVRVVVGSGAAC
jgi:hypothetical protein